ncbi:protein Hcp, partial [Cronobacter turicensis]
PYEQEYYFITKPRYETVKNDTQPEKTNVYRQATDEISTLGKCPNLRPLMANGEVTTETWYDYLVNHNKKNEGLTEKRVGAAVTLKRIVPNDWSKVSLRVMIDAAKEGGVDITEILPKDKNFKLPKELEALSQKAISQGINIRNGGIPIPFSSAELQSIGKYTHCSANWNPVEFKTVWLDGKEIKRIYGA